MEQRFVPVTKFDAGWEDRNDSPHANGGIIMRDVMVSDRGGIRPRPGEELFGVADSGSTGITGLHTMRRRDGVDVMQRVSGNNWEYYHNDLEKWVVLRNDVNTGVFGFQDYGSRNDDTDFTYMGNGVDPIRRWPGQYSEVATTTAIGSSQIPVATDGVLYPETFYQSYGNVASSTTTTIDITGADWAADLWDGYWVKITSGAQSGQVRLITATTSTQITFGTIAGLTGTPSFQIRRIRFPVSYGMVFGDAGTQMTTTGITQHNAFDISTLTTAGLTAGDAITRINETLVANQIPRGNILQTFLDKMFIAGVKAFPQTIYRSKSEDASDYTYSSPRAAGEGDVIEVPESGRGIADLEQYEDALLIIKRDVIEQITYSQDGEDIVNRKTLIKSPNIGVTEGAKAFRVGSDIWFPNFDNEISSFGRIVNYADFPQRRNIAFPIKNGVRNYRFDKCRGITFKNFTLMAGRSNKNSTSNDKILVHDNDRKIWIGEWTVPASEFTIYDDGTSIDLYYGSSANKEVYKMFTGLNKVKGNNTFASSSYYQTQWRNFTPEGNRVQQFDTIYVSGYITEGTKVEFSLFYDFASDPDLVWTFDPLNVEETILGSQSVNALGYYPIGVSPLSMTIGNEVEGEFNERRFEVWFKVPPTQHTFLSIGFGSDGNGQFYDITELKTNVMDTGHTNQQRVWDVENDSTE